MLLKVDYFFVTKMLGIGENNVPTLLFCIANGFIKINQSRTMKDGIVNPGKEMASDALNHHRET